MAAFAPLDRGVEVPWAGLRVKIGKAGTRVVSYLYCVLGEVEAIVADKQRVLQQWKSSVVGMKRREEALQAIKQMVTKQEEKELEVEAEMRGVQVR